MMSKFPVDAPLWKVIRDLEGHGFLDPGRKPHCNGEAKLGWHQNTVDYAESSHHQELDPA